MSDWPLLSLVTFLPLVGAAFILLIRGDEAIVAQNARGVALWTSLVTFLLSLLDPRQLRQSSQAGFQLVEQRELAARASASTTTWASMASRSGSCCSPPC